jgi:hypothetical protein
MIYDYKIIKGLNIFLTVTVNQGWIQDLGKSGAQYF